MSAEVSGYESEKEIPVSTLLKRDAGSLKLLRRSAVWQHIQAFLPKASSAFDSNKTILEASYSAYNEQMNKFVIHSLLLRLRLQGIQSNNDQLVIKMVARITELVLKQGINKGNRLELRWAAAQGPWPSWTTDEQHFSSMQGAYYLLLDIARTTLRNERLTRYVIQEISCILSYAWDGISTWRH